MKAGSMRIEKAPATYATFVANGKPLIAENLMAGHYFIVDMFCYAVHENGFLYFEDGAKIKAFRTLAGSWDICRKKYNEASENKRYNRRAR